jgi:hypothetical protein
MSTQFEQWLDRLQEIVTFTSDGQVTLLRNVGSVEDLVVTCLVAQNVAHRAGKTPKATMSVDDFIAAGGLAHSAARQSVYNSTSKLAQRKIIQKRGNEFFVDERTVLQYVAARLPPLTAHN